MNFNEYIPQDDPKGINTLVTNPAAVAAAMSGGTVSQTIAFRGGSRVVMSPDFVRAVQAAAAAYKRTPTPEEIIGAGYSLGIWTPSPSLWAGTFKPLLQTTAAVGVFFAGGAYLANVAAGVSGASVGATSAGASTVAAASPVAVTGSVAAVASAPVAATLSGAMTTTLTTAGAGLVKAATAAAGVAITSAIAPPKPAQPVPTPTPSPHSSSGLGTILALAAAGAVLLLPLP